VKRSSVPARGTRWGTNSGRLFVDLSTRPAKEPPSRYRRLAETRRRPWRDGFLARQESSGGRQSTRSTIYAEATICRTGNGRQAIDALIRTDPAGSQFRPGDKGLKPTGDHRDQAWARLTASQIDNHTLRCVGQGRLHDLPVVNNHVVMTVASCYGRIVRPAADLVSLPVPVRARRPRARLPAPLLRAAVYERSRHRQCRSVARTRRTSINAIPSRGRGALLLGQAVSTVRKR